MSATAYKRSVRAVSRGMWSGVFTYEQFFDDMLGIIRRGLTRAWERGMKQCGMSLDDMTADERLKLEQAIVSEGTYLNRYALWLLDNTQEQGGSLSQVLSRADMWSTRYTDVMNQAKLIACADEKLKWTWNPRKEHCSSCRRLNGRTYRASVWDKNGVRPQNPPNSLLECQGWKCGCSLDPTNDKITPGPFPNLP